ncbi:type III PLP-dependent enzyme domain-containing protein [Cohnella cholangitidis]|uniref:Decarboxylase n=1 Tax=Cohnella cholangitidis TaxID=2598458 RepID=A0A7G5BUG7_9BACL|nr:hypothetical protein [Cohnella cholangitidis]QMV40601.1 hypothetical protein FPL14_04825 [Cohnella cholangitidis]
MNYSDLVRKYGSPLYVYNIDALADSYHKLRSYLPDDSILYYSLKANPHPVLVGQLVRLGCRCEVSSVNELAVALQAGARADRVQYTGPAKTRNEIETAVIRGVRLFSCESWNEFDKLNSVAEEHATKLAVVLRVNPNSKNLRSSLAMTGVSSQFGIDEDKIMNGSLDFLAHPSMEVIGFHVFNGTNSTDVGSLIDSFAYSIQMAKRLAEELNINLRYLNLGGGFGHPYAKFGDSPNFSILKSELTALLDSEIPEWRNNETQVAFESGRFIAGSCGQYICSIEDIKESKGSRYVILNGGINHLGGMSGLGRMQKLDVDFAVSDEASSEENDIASLVGPLCTPLDFIRRPGEIPKLDINDHIVIPNVGAYGLTSSLLGFLSRESPLEIVYSVNEVIDISRIELERKKY